MKWDENKRHKIKKYQKQNKKSHKRNFEFNFDFDFESSSNCDQFLFADKRKMMMWLSCVCKSLQYPLFTLHNCCNPRPLPLPQTYVNSAETETDGSNLVWHVFRSNCQMENCASQIRKMQQQLDKRLRTTMHDKQQGEKTWERSMTDYRSEEKERHGDVNLATV